MKYVVKKELDDKIHYAAEMASRFFSIKTDLIAKVEYYSFTVKTPKQVADDIYARHNQFVLNVVPWKPFNPWTAAIATTFTSNPTTIHINVRKIASRDLSDYIATLVHESLHCMGYNHGTGRGANSNQHKEPKLSSVPIKVAYLAKSWSKTYVF